MGVNDIMEMGRQGLTANRQALQTTSNNIANVNTPGYSRQRTVMQSNDTQFANGHRLGGGVDVPQTIRVHDDFVQRQLLEESPSFGGFKVKMEGLSRAESVVQSSGTELGGSISKFFDDLRELSVNPEMSTLRGNVKASAEGVAKSFQRINASLNNIKSELDLRINGTVDQVNGLSKELAELNGNITRLEGAREVPNEMYDRRDQVVRELAQKLDLQISTDDIGNVNCVAAGSVLVNGNQANQLYTARTPADGEKAANSLDIIMKDTSGSTHKITGSIKDGELGGLVHVRDNVVNQSLEHVDGLALQFSRAVNNVHEQGVGMDGLTGRKLFADLGESQNGASARFDVSDDLKAGHEAIAAGFSIQNAGDNRIALALTDIQDSKLLPSGIGEGQENSATFNESINALIGKVGTAAARESEYFRHQEGVVQQLENYRQTISGVSLEEEAINLIKFQTAFNAAAKTMKVGDELLQTILSIKT